MEVPADSDPQRQIDELAALIETNRVSIEDLTARADASLERADVAERRADVAESRADAAESRADVADVAERRSDRPWTGR